MALMRFTIRTDQSASPAPSALTAVALIVAFAALPTALSARERLPGPVQADVIRVHDGDTLQVRARIWMGQVISTKVRLAGVDTPELRGRCHREQRMAEAARDFVKRKLNDPRVTLHDIRYGKYAGRVLARVITARGEDLGAALIAAGLARPYRGRRRGSWCEQAQRR
jgi:endonuclease YncB( thermonuclease family)